MGKRSEQTIHKISYMNDKEAHERCSTSFVIREKQNKATKRYYCAPIRIAKNNKLAIPSTTHYEKQLSAKSLTVPSKVKYILTFDPAIPLPLNIYLPFDPATPLPSIYPREMKNYGPTEIYRQMLTETLFIISKTTNPLVNQ